MKAFEVSGLWWLPSLEQHQVGGILSFTPEEGIKLELLGFLGNPDIEQLQQLLGMNPQQLTAYPIVVGVTTSNEFVTLQY